MQDLDDDIFSADEQMFFESGGANVGKLFEPPPAEKAETVVSDAPVLDPATGKPPVKDKAKGGEDDDGAGAIDLDEGGRVKDAKTGRYVPVGVLRETRGELKSAKAKLAETEATTAKLLSVFERFAGALPPQPAAKKEAPAEVALIEPATDIVGAIMQERALRIAETKARQESDARTAAQITGVERNRVMAQEIGGFRSKTADFDDAVQHLATVRERQYGRLYAFRGADGQPDKAKVTAAVQSDIQGVIDDALLGKANPGKALYDWAVEEFGYKAKGAAVTTATTDTTKETGTEKTPAQQALEAIAAGSDSARTLSSSGGGVSGGLTADQFVNMDEDELYARLQSNPAFQNEIDRVMGRR